MKTFRENRFTSIHVGVKQFCIVDDLADGDYYVRIRAVNSYGEGPNCDEEFFSIEGN